MLGLPVRELMGEDAELELGVPGVETPGEARGLGSVENEARRRFLEQGGQPVVELGGGDVKRVGDVSGFVGRARAEVEHEGPGVDAPHGLVGAEGTEPPTPPIDLVHDKEHEHDAEGGDKPGMGVDKEV